MRGDCAVQALAQGLRQQGPRKCDDELFARDFILEVVSWRNPSISRDVAGGLLAQQKLYLLIKLPLDHCSAWDGLIELKWKPAVELDGVWSCKDTHWQRSDFSPALSLPSVCGVNTMPSTSHMSRADVARDISILLNESPRATRNFDKKWYNSCGC